MIDLFCTNIQGISIAKSSPNGQSPSPYTVNFCLFTVHLYPESELSRCCVQEPLLKHRLGSQKTTPDKPAAEGGGRQVLPKGERRPEQRLEAKRPRPASSSSADRDQCRDTKPFKRNNANDHLSIITKDTESSLVNSPSGGHSATVVESAECPIEEALLEATSSAIATATPTPPSMANRAEAESPQLAGRSPLHKKSRKGKKKHKKEEKKREGRPHSHHHHARKRKRKSGEGNSSDGEGGPASENGKQLPGTGTSTWRLSRNIRFEQLYRFFGQL